MVASRRAGVSDRLHSAALHLVRAVRTVDAEMGLTPARASALSVLVFGGPRTIGALAAAEGVRSPTMTALVTGLEAEGLVRRRAATVDARQVIVEPTAKGRRILEKGRRRRVERLERLLSAVADDDVAVLDRAAALIETAIAADRRGPVA